MGIAIQSLMKLFALEGLSLRGIYGASWRQIARDLWNEIIEDNILNGAAALGFYFLLSLFPAMIFLLSLLPYLPIANLSGEILSLLAELLPGDAYKIFAGTVREITSKPQGGLLSFGAAFTLWAASSGMYAIMQHLNFTYDVKDSRPYWKARGMAILLTIVAGALIVVAFALVMAGSALQSWLTFNIGLERPLVLAFAALRWLVISFALGAGFALTYYFGPDVKQEFRFITPGSLMGVILLAAACLGFKLYAENFGSYNITYGSIGAVIVLMLWLNLLGTVILLGSEVNALVEHYSPEGKIKGQKTQTGEGSGPNLTFVKESEPPREAYAAS